MERSGIGDIIRQVLDVEGEAQKIVAESEQKARDGIARAREEGRKLVDEARRAALDTARKAADATIEAARKARDDSIARETEADARVVETCKAKTGEAVEVIVREIAGPRLDGTQTSHRQH